MASREELAMIRRARAGQVVAQLALGERYLFGGGGLPQSAATALHWLERAARQNCEQAWALIGKHIPYEVAARSTNPLALCEWYERAFKAGVAQAGLVFARLALAQNSNETHALLRDKAIKTLESAADAGLSDAKWLLTELSSGALPTNEPSTSDTQNCAPCTCIGSVTPAQQGMANQAWEAGDRDTYLQWALPLARDVARCQIRINAAESCPDLGYRLSEQDARLLSRCAQVLAARDSCDPEEVQLFWELATQNKDEQAPFFLGLWLARMDETGTRRATGPGSSNFKKAVRCLTLAGERGMAEAWFALSRIYLKPEFSQRKLETAQDYLVQAAEMGHPAAQLECGINAWRMRREDETSDVRAAYWLQKAAAQGNSDAVLLLDKIAPRALPAPWALEAQHRLTREMRNGHSLLTARIDLAALFGLSRAEALLLDVHGADQGHCLVIDIRVNYGRSKRRLIRLQTAQERQDLDRIVRLFDNIDTSIGGGEGNYRQRQYRLKSLLPKPASA